MGGWQRGDVLQDWGPPAWEGGRLFTWNNNKHIIRNRAPMHVVGGAPARKNSALTKADHIHLEHLHTNINNVLKQVSIRSKRNLASACRSATCSVIFSTSRVDRHVRTAMLPISSARPRAARWGTKGEHVTPRGLLHSERGRRTS
jgi:hypothetical protein